jgi:hypothetical protein
MTTGIREKRVEGPKWMVKLLGVVILAVMGYMNYLWWERVVMSDRVYPRVDLMLCFVISWGIVGSVLLGYHLRNRKKAHVVEEKDYFIIT